MRRSLLPLVCASVALLARAQEPLSLFWSGALQPTSANVRVRTAQPGDTVQLRYCAAPCPNGPTSTQALVTDTATDNVLSFLLDDLQPGTHYTYRFAVNGVLDTVASSLGRFTTPRSGPASFTFVTGSCNTFSNHRVWEAMLARDPILFVNSGDLHYRDPNSELLDVHRAPYREDVLSVEPMRSFLHAVPIAYVWDDHDFCGDGSDGSRIGKANAARAFRDYVPHYELHHDKSVHQAFTIGRVHFILSDLRSSKTPTQMMDSAQFAWLRNEFVYARDHALVAAWVSPLTWNAEGYPENWGCQPDERERLANYLYHQQVKDLFILSGDAHMLAIDGGTHADFSTSGDSPYRYPIFQAAAISRSGSYKGGEFDQGGWFPNPSSAHGQFGEVIVNDDGTDVCITFNGWRTLGDTSGTELINTYTFCRRPPLSPVRVSTLDHAPARTWYAAGSLWRSEAENATPMHLQVVDAIGRDLIQLTLEPGTTDVPLHRLPAGCYVATLSGEGTLEVVRFAHP